MSKYTVKEVIQSLYTKGLIDYHTYNDLMLKIETYYV